MISKQTLLVAAGVGIGAFALTELVLTVRERKKEPTHQEKVDAAIEKIRESYSGTEFEMLDYQEEILRNEFVTLERPDDSEMRVPDEKPDLMSYYTYPEEPVEETQLVHQNVFDKEQPEEEGEPVGTNTEEYLARIGKTRWNTNRIPFDDEGIPQFTDEEWNSEGGSIEVISQEEYEGELWSLYDRDQAIWYPDDGVMADQEFNLLDVVDCVGPNAFSMMVKSKGGIVYVRNDELQKCYEIWENDVDFEEALEDSGFGDNVHIRLE